MQYILNVIEIKYDINNLPQKFGKYLFFLKEPFVNGEVVRYRKSMKKSMSFYHSWCELPKSDTPHITPYLLSIAEKCSTPPKASGEQLQWVKASELLTAIEGYFEEAPVDFVGTSDNSEASNKEEKEWYSGWRKTLSELKLLLSESASLVKEPGKDQAEHAPSQVKEGHSIQEKCDHLHTHAWPGKPAICQDCGKEL